jgi:hypothetical protein
MEKKFERTTFRNLSTKIVPNKKDKIIKKELKKEIQEIRKYKNGDLNV